MVIVLVLFFLLVGVGGTVWYKRHKKARDMAGGNGGGTSWGPNASAHDFNTTPAAVGTVVQEKPRKAKLGRVLRR